MNDNKRPRILAVDDDPTVLNILSALDTKYELTPLPSVELALRFLQTNRVDLILSDYYMGQVTGFDFYDQAQNIPLNAKVPFIFLTGATEGDLEVMALEKGAIEFISKPVKLPVLFARVAMVLKVISYVRNLEQVIEDRTRDIQSAHDMLIHMHESVFSLLANATYVRDEGTGGHIKRTNELARVIVEALAIRGRLTATEASDIIKSSSLHDIGKIGIKDSVLLKPGALTDEEFGIIKTHTTIGGEILKRYTDEDGAMSFLGCAREIALHHHEKYDGTGYPFGLKGKDIPLPARIMAVVDVYDALTSKRVYKEKMTHEQAAKIIKDGRGTHFDPDLVDIFTEREERFKQIESSMKEQ